MRLVSLLVRPLLAVLGCAALWPQPSAAVTFDNLYTVRVAPDPAARDQREAAIEAAMARLLIRVTGNRNAPLEPMLQPLLEAPDQFLQSYGLDLQGRALVGFNGGRIERALTERGMPVWGPERPLTLLWIALDDGVGGRALLRADGVSEEGVPMTPMMADLVRQIQDEVASVADERGLPIAWPLLDLEDLGAVTFTDVWGGFEAEVISASQRYRADAVLIGRVRPGVFGTEVDWLFVSGIERRALPLASVRDGLDVAADRYAADFRTVGGASVAMLTVQGVLTPADYGRVISYLERQSVLETVDVESFEGGTLRMRVAARGDARVIERVLALGNVLRPAATAGPFGAVTFEVVRDGSTP